MGQLDIFEVALGDAANEEYHLRTKGPDVKRSVQRVGTVANSLNGVFEIEAN